MALLFGYATICFHALDYAASHSLRHCSANRGEADSYAVDWADDLLAMAVGAGLILELHMMLFDPRKLLNS